MTGRLPTAGCAAGCIMPAAGLCIRRNWTKMEGLVAQVKLENGPEANHCMSRPGLGTRMEVGCSGLVQELFGEFPIVAGGVVWGPELALMERPK